MALDDDFIAFFNEKKKGIYVCPVCGNHVMALNAENEAMDKNEQISEFRIPTVTGASHSFYSLACTNCGFTTLFHRNQFDAWQAAKKPAGEK